MSLQERSLLRATLAMIGTIIGAGLFGLPAAFSLVGFVPGTILFIVIALAVTLTHLILAEQFLATREHHRVTGLVLRGLGPFAAQVSSITYPLHIIASNYAYLLLGGEFLAVVGHAFNLTLPVAVWQLLFWAAGAATVLFGLKVMAKVEAQATILLMIVLGLAVALAAPMVDFSGITFTNWSSWNLPFGIFLFALSGLSVVSEIVEIAGRRRKQAYLAVGGGTVIASILSWIFGVVIFLAARGFPIRDAADLVAVLPSGFGLVIPLLGFLAVATSYLTTAEALVATFVHDHKWKRPVAYAIGLSAPVFMLALLSRDFLSTISFIGAIFVGINSILVCALGYKAMSRHARHASRYVVGSAGCALLIGVYVFGILQKIFTREGF